MKTLRTTTLLLVLVGLPAVARGDLGTGRLTGDVVIDAKLVVVSFSSNGGWSEELGFDSDVIGKYQVTALMGITVDNTVIEYGSIDVKGRANPFLSYQFDFTNFGSDPIDDLYINTIIEIEPLNELSFMTSLLSVEYVDHDGSGGINSTASHRAYPQTESLGGFAAQEIVLTINEAGKFEEILDPTLPDVPEFPPPPFNKLATSFSITNLLPGDSIIVTGRTDMEVPEPSSLTLALLGGSAFLVCFFGRRSRRSLARSNSEQCELSCPTPTPAAQRSQERPRLCGSVKVNRIVQS